MTHRAMDINGKKIILVQIDPKYLLPSDRKKFFQEKNLENLQRKWEKFMNYSSMVKALQEGKKATRPSWDEGMFVWFARNMVLHTHPYWPDQEKVADQNGFPYVCEKDDGVAEDWILVAM